jgi:hypothetical protein
VSGFHIAVMSKIRETYGWWNHTFPPSHPSFVLGVIHALLCTAEASPSVFKRLLQWENRTRQVFCLKYPPVCREDLMRAGIGYTGELCNMELDMVRVLL